MTHHYVKYGFLNIMITLWLLMLTSTLAQSTTKNRVPIQFESQNSLLQGWLYTAPGNTERPLILLLQGSVGTDGDVLGIGQALSESHFHVMTYNYPGTWRSEGQRSDSSALQSVYDAIHYLKTDPHSFSGKIDTTQIILAGYSYGGGMALLAASKDSSIQTVISIAGGDLSVRAEQLLNNHQYRSQFEQMLDNMISNPVMVRGTTGKNYVETLIKTGHKYSLMTKADKLSQKRILLISGWHDMRVKLENHILPLYRELISRGAVETDLTVLETDHSFNGSVENLHQELEMWLAE
jgi:dipeptidyl aminopeptidase/acylaminoacyl peptidase